MSVAMAGSMLDAFAGPAWLATGAGASI